MSSHRAVVVAVACLLVTVPAAAVGQAPTAPQAPHPPGLAAPLEAQMLAPDAAGEGATVGACVDAEDGWVAVCARHDGRADPAAVYVYERSLSGWVLDARLDTRGVRAVDLSGETLVVGIPSADAIDVFEHDGAAWAHQQRLTAPGLSQGSLSGTSVAVDGDTIVAGAWVADAFARDSGRSDVFEQDEAGTWSWTARLGASVLGPADRAGFSVDVDGDTIAVSAHLDDAAGPNAGAVHVYQATDEAGWTHQQTLTASDAEGFDRFGRKLALDGDVLVAGALFEDAAAENAGAAYVFERGLDGGFSESAKLVPDDAGSFDLFGWSVDVTGHLVVVGAWLHDGAGENAGAVYAYTGLAGAWLEHAKLVPGGISGELGVADGAEGGELFGFSVAASQHAVVAGAPEDTVEGTTSGSARLFPALAP